MQPPPVQFERWFACRDAVGREARVVIAVSEGELTVAPPLPGGFRFGPDQLDEAKRFHASFAFGLELLERQREEQALVLGLEMLSRRERPKKRRRRS